MRQNMDGLMRMITHVKIGISWHR